MTAHDKAIEAAHTAVRELTTAHPAHIADTAIQAYSKALLSETPDRAELVKRLGEIRLNCAAAIVQAEEPGQSLAALSNYGDQVLQLVPAIITLLSIPAPSGEVTDEMVKRALGAFDDGVGDPNDYYRRMRKALESARTPTDTGGEITPDDIQLLMHLHADNHESGARPVLEGKGDWDQALRLGDLGLIAIESVSLGGRLHVTRLGSKTIDRYNSQKPDALCSHLQFLLAESSAQGSGNSPTPKSHKDVCATKTGDYVAQDTPPQGELAPDSWFIFTDGAYIKTGSLYTVQHAKERGLHVEAAYTQTTVDRILGERDEALNALRASGQTMAWSEVYRHSAITEAHLSNARQETRQECMDEADVLAIIAGLKATEEAMEKIIEATGFLPNSIIEVSVTKTGELCKIIREINTIARSVRSK